MFRHLFRRERYPVPESPPERIQSTDCYLDIQFVRRSDGRVLLGDLGYRTGPDTSVFLKVLDAGVDARSGGFDLFEAFQSARRTIERRGFIPCVRGARIDCHPSGMARSMGDGDLVYELTLGQSPTPSDLGFIFEPCAPDQVATIRQQLTWYDRWSASLEDR